MYRSKKYGALCSKRMITYLYRCYYGNIHVKKSINFINYEILLFKYSCNNATGYNHKSNYSLFIHVLIHILFWTLSSSGLYRVATVTPFQCRLLMMVQYPHWDIGRNFDCTLSQRIFATLHFIVSFFIWLTSKWPSL